MVQRGRGHGKEDAAEDGGPDGREAGGSGIVNDWKYIVAGAIIAFLLAVAGFYLKYAFWVKLLEGVVGP